jgi:predicted transcriptional regulator
MVAMQTRVSVRKDLAERLAELAELRGEVGIAHLVEEALQLFLAEEDRRRAALERRFRGLGAVPPEEILIRESSRSA